MHFFKPAWLATLALLSWGFVASGTASAANGPLTLNCTKYASGTVPASCNTTPTVLSTPGAYTYADVGLQPSTSTGGIIAGSQYPGAYSGASFYDAFVIQITASQGTSITSTIDLSLPGQASPSFQITNFEERLYKLSSTAGVAPFVGVVPGALDAWSQAISIGSTNGSVAVLPTTQLSAGTYVLEMRGNVTGSAGGAYSGTLQLQAPTVPLPAGIWLLVSGIAGFTGITRRRRKT